MAILPKSRSKRDYLDAIVRLDMSEFYYLAGLETVYVTMPEFRFTFEEDQTSILIKKLNMKGRFTPRPLFCSRKAMKVVP